MLIRRVDLVFQICRLDLSKKVELFMADVLVALVEESPGLPSGVLDILLSQFSTKIAVRFQRPASSWNLSPP